MTRLTCLAALLAAAPAFAATPINEIRPLSPEGQVEIENLKGEIIVRTWDRPEVRIAGSLGEGVEKLDIHGGADSLDIEVRYPKGGGWFGGGDRSEPSRLEVTVPARAAVTVDAVSASVDVEGVQGRLLSVDNVSGGIRVRNARVGEARFDNVSGDLDVEVDSPEVSVDNVSGDIRLVAPAGGRLMLDTVSGDAEVSAGPVGSLGFSSVSGDARLALALAPGGRLSADTVSGGLRLRLPADTSARLHVETFSGSISSPVGEVRTEKYGPGKSLEARLGQGDGEIRLEAFSGGVRLELDPK